MKLSNIKDKALLEILMSEINRSAEKIPKGFYQSEYWQKKWGYANAHTYVVLNRGIKLGVIECKMFRTQVGRLCKPIKFYRHIKKT